MSEVALIKIEDIIVEDRSRDVDEAWVAALANDILLNGMRHPITVLMTDGGPRLVAGLHRLEAHRLNAETHIEATWSNAETLAAAKVQEVSENIVRRELCALDRAKHLFDLKAAYEELHPETKAGVAGGKARQGTASEIISFADDIAETLGLSPRAIQIAVAIWKGLSDSSKQWMRGTWMADHQASLIQLSKQKPNIQKKVLEMVLPMRGAPKAASVADALYILENGRLLSSVEKRFSSLNKTLSSLADKELDAVLVANETRIMEWVERRLGGGK